MVLTCFNTTLLIWFSWQVWTFRQNEKVEHGWEPQNTADLGSYSIFSLKLDLYQTKKQEVKIVDSWLRYVLWCQCSVIFTKQEKARHGTVNFHHDACFFGLVNTHILYVNSPIKAPLPIKAPPVFCGAPSLELERVHFFGLVDSPPLDSQVPVDSWVQKHWKVECPLKWTWTRGSQWTALP